MDSCVLTVYNGNFYSHHGKSNDVLKAKSLNTRLYTMYMEPPTRGLMEWNPLNGIERTPGVGTSSSQVLGSPTWSYTSRWLIGLRSYDLLEVYVCS